jgi:hypothetical protein
VTRELIFWAQALDNSSPDHIYMHGNELTPGETERRQEAVSLVSSVVKTGKRIFASNGVQLTTAGQRFIIEIPSVQRDSVGRAAPIVCYGDSEISRNDSIENLIMTGLDTFATQIGRSLRRDHVDLVRVCINLLKKKSSKKYLARGIFIVLTTLTVLVLLYWQISKNS